MKTRAIDQGKRQKPFEFCRELFRLTMGGGAVFWLTTIATSLLPVAARYRAAFSNWSIQAVWIGSLLVGMIIGCCVSYSLLRFQAKIPAKDPILKAVILSAFMLVIALALVDAPMIFRGSGDALYYFLIGVVFNITRFLFLGIAIGCLHKSRQIWL